MASDISIAVDDTFISKVENVRVEIETKFARTHQILDERKATLLSHLDQLETSYRGDGVIEQMEELTQLNDLQLSSMKRNENKDILMEHVASLDTRINEIREKLVSERASMKSVVLEWDGEFESKLSELGTVRVSAIPDYKQKGKALLSACKHGCSGSKSAGLFKYPQSIAIDNETNNIYICDAGNNFVQVLNKSFEFLFPFSEKMMWPVGICISNDKVYVTQNLSNSVNVYSIGGGLLKSFGKEGKKKLEFARPRAIAVSTEKNRIYICDSDNDRIQCLNLGLTFHSFIRDVPYPRDIKLTTDHVVVLTSGNPCIRFYNYSNQLIKEMISGSSEESDHLENPWYFCLDQECNILTTYESCDCVSIFSNQGEIINKFGNCGEGMGDLIGPTGIALNSENQIIVVSCNPNHCIQLF